MKYRNNSSNTVKVPKSSIFQGNRIKFYRQSTFYFPTSTQEYLKNIIQSPLKLPVFNSYSISTLLWSYSALIRYLFGHCRMSTGLSSFSICFYIGNDCTFLTLSPWRPDKKCENSTGLFSSLYPDQIRYKFDIKTI